MCISAGVAPFTFGSLVPNVTEFAVILGQLTNLPEEVISGLLTTPIDPMKVR